MVNSVTARTRVLHTGAVNKEITFTMNDPKYVVKNIEGLGPVKADVSTIPDVSDRGNTYLSARDGGRNIVFTLGFNPIYSANETITVLRRKLYEVFMPKNDIELDFTVDGIGVVRIKGHVESHEPVIFTKDPQVQISILCHDPYFQSLDGLQSYTLPGGTGTQFSFNFDGFVPSGFIFDFVMTGARPFGMSLHGETPRIGNRTLGLTLPLLTGDSVLFNTIKGERAVTYTRSSSTQSALGYFTGSLVDSKLYNGLNYFRLNDIGWMSNVRFRWYKMYGGL